jgi:hypothetical protein
MDYYQALIHLQRADEEDKYQTRCKTDSLNAKAREKCVYLPWHDQSDAKKINTSLEEQSFFTHCIIMNPSADGGMPHTRAGGLICIPAYWPRASLEETIRHELVHVHQKQYPDVWREKLIEDGWGLVSEVDAKKEIPEDTLRRCRLNPDTLDARFAAWAGRWIPLPLFEREDKPNLKEIQVRWWDRQEQRLLLSPPTSFTQKYGSGKSNAQLEHPFELYAYLI